MTITDDWTGCYPSSWKGIITPESFAHPAKFSSRLIERIYQHILAEGWLHEGDRIIDPFGGVGLGAWPALRYGLDWTGVELEPRFVELGNANITAWNAAYAGRVNHWGTARLLQGDSRNLAQVVSGASAAISSPPYTETPITQRRNFLGPHSKNGQLANLITEHREDGYGITPGQLGSLPAGDYKAVISSPPYAVDVIRDRSGDLEQPRLKKKGKTNQKYGLNSNGKHPFEAYGYTSSNLGNLPAGDWQAVVSSPPFEKAPTGRGIVINGYQNEELRPGAELKPFQLVGQRSYIPENQGQTIGQLSNYTGETFWAAARAIIAQVYQVLAPGGHAVWVVKEYVKNKQLIDFPHQWQEVCKACGFITLHEHHALLVRHKGTSLALDGSKVEHKVESKSFFRRLAEKNGSPHIDYETVICQVKE